MVMTRGGRRKALPLAFLVCAQVVMLAQPANETLEVSLTLSGSLEAGRRVSDNFLMTEEQWFINSTFTQSSNFRLVREPSGRVGGAPTSLFDAMSAQDSLFEPIVSPFDAVEFKLWGQIAVVTCGGGGIFAHDLSSVRKGPAINVPPGLPSTFVPNVNMTDVSSLANRGTFFIRACDKRPDQLLVYYMPPAGLFEVPGAPTVKCNDQYSYERPPAEDAQYQPYLLSAKYRKAVAAECPGATPAEGMAFLGSVSWNGLNTGAKPRLEAAYEGEEGVPSGQEPFHGHTLKLTLDIARR